LNVFNWSNYVAPDTIPNFEREFGVRVRYSVYESNEEMLAKVMTGNSGWDVVFPSHSRIGPMAANGLLATLDRARLTNVGNLDPFFQKPWWDAELQHCVPYMWGTTGIIYNRSLIPPPAAWADLWNERLRGRITMLDDPEDVLGACLQKLHLPFSSIDPEELRAAKREAIAQKHLLRAYLNAEVRDQLVSKDVLAAQLWATTSRQAMQASRDLAFVYPAEGFALYADCAVILRESRRLELGHQFIDYLLRARVAADIANASETATANAAGRALLAAGERDSVVLYPADETLKRGAWPQTLPAAGQRLRDRIWTEIKSA
jgi:spermidine/putrescine transport system substrate-binding protein